MSKIRLFFTSSKSENLSTYVKILNKWFFIFGILTVVLIIFSHGIWVNLIEDLRQVLKEILIDA